MNPKRFLCAMLLLGAIGSAFALASFVQITPANTYSLALIKSRPVAGHNELRDYFVVLLPQKGNDSIPASWTGSLELNDGTNRLTSCNVDGVMLSDRLGKDWRESMASMHYWVITNLFSQPLRGAKLFQFEVATNLLAGSRFIMYDRDDSSYSVWFALGDFGCVGKK